MLKKNFKIPEVTDIDVKRNCEHCGKKNVCKYKERVEEAENSILNLLDYDEGYADLPLTINIKCKEFSVGYTGVR